MVSEGAFLFPPMFDAHLHLTDSRILAETTQFCSGAIACAVRPAEWKALPTDLPASVTLAFGIHPWYAEEYTDETLAALREILLQHPTACVGEIGLDGCRDETHQLNALIAQLKLAAELHRPVILHCVRSWGKLIDTLLPWQDKIPSWMVHGVNCSADLLTHPFCNADTVFFSVGSFTRPLTEKRTALLRAIPSDRLLIESDAPDGLLPEQSYAETLTDTVIRLAAIRNTTPAELTKATAANAIRFLSCR